MTTPARTRPRIAVIQHEDGCPLGLFDPWLRDAGAMLDVVRPDRGEPLPALGVVQSGDDGDEPADDDGDEPADDGRPADGRPEEGRPDDRRPDGVIVLGGSMSATDDERAPWLPAVRDLLRRAVHHRVPTLGICLGHQLLAVAGGGVVGPNPTGKQMGALPVGWTAAATAERLFGLTTQRASARGVQWNDDIVVELPAGATLLAATPHGVPQVMRVGDAAWGVQFHPEVDHGVVAAWAAESGPVTPAASAALAAIADAEDDLAATWRPFAARFVEIVAESASASPNRPDQGHQDHSVTVTK